jgi:cysteine desulfurase
LAEQGYDITYLPVAPNGLVSLQAIRNAIRPETCLVSIMAVNNEIGVIQPLQEIGQMLRDLQKESGGSKVLFHTDAAQAVGKIAIDVDRMGIDVLSISGHKLYGPKGIGAAYIRRRPRVRLEPLIHGGGQERGLRSGTVPAVLVVGLGEACRIAEREMQVCLSLTSSVHTLAVHALENRLSSGVGGIIAQSQTVAVSCFTTKTCSTSYWRVSSVGFGDTCLRLLSTSI